jgi:hypothetical protein
MARRTVPNHWFVSSVVPRKLRLGTTPRTFARETKTFPTEAEAKQYANQILSERKNVIAGTFLSGHQPTRRIISGRALLRWIGEE